MANWPGIVDYETAIQNPDKFFKTSDLQQAKFETFPNGSKVLTGNFAAVYKAILPPSVTTLVPGTYALRVFHREPLKGMKDRYEAISKYLERFQTPYFVEYKYLEDEILAKGARRPVILMKWVEGLSFGQYIAKHYKDKDTMLYIAGTFMGSIMAGLRGLKMAHGDLQDGNAILDDQSNIILVDYDDIFAPVSPLIGGQSNGMGKSEFNHPKRTKKLFGPETDNFASLVIYLSLGALAEKPDLFAKYNNGDNIIFKKDDYLNPKGTTSWNDVLALKNPVIHDLALMLSDACKLGPDELEKVPNLVDAINDIGQALPAGKKPAVVVQTTIPKPTPTQPTVLITPTAPAQPTPSAPALPQIVLPTTNLPFGDIRLGQVGSKTFQIQNSGTADLNIQSVSSNNPAFTVQNLPSRTVAAGGPPLVITVEFHPTTRGAASGVVEVRSNDPNSPILRVNIQGEGISPEISVSPKNIDLGKVELGSESAAQKIRVKNIGSADLTLLSVDTSNSNFIVGTYPAIVVPNDEKEIEVKFAPLAIGVVTGKITIKSDDSTNPTEEVAVQGEGVKAQPLKVTAVVPSSGPHGAIDYKVRVIGENFPNVENNIVVDLGAGVLVQTIQPISRNILEVTVDITHFAALTSGTSGRRDALVVNTIGGESGKLANAFSITAGAPLMPTVLSISPEKFVLGDESFFSVTGTNFKKDGENLPAIFSTAPGLHFLDLEYGGTSLKAKIVVPLAGCPAGTYDIIVVNPDGKQGVGKGLLTIESVPAGLVRCRSCNQLTGSAKKFCGKCGRMLETRFPGRP